MPSNFNNKQPDLSLLKSVLMTSGLQIKDNPTFQVLSGLIDYVDRIQKLINSDITVLEASVESISDTPQIIPVFVGSDDEFEYPQVIPGPQGIPGINGINIPGIDGLD